MRAKRRYRLAVADMIDGRALGRAAKQDDGSREPRDPVPMGGRDRNNNGRGRGRGQNNRNYRPSHYECLPISGSMPMRQNPYEFTAKVVDSESSRRVTVWWDSQAQVSLISHRSAEEFYSNFIREIPEGITLEGVAKGAVVRSYACLDLNLQFDSTELITRCFLLHDWRWECDLIIGQDLDPPKAHLLLSVLVSRHTEHKQVVGYELEPEALGTIQLAVMPESEETPLQEEIVPPVFMNIADEGESSSEARKALSRMITEAQEHGLPNAWVPRLRGLLQKYANVFRSSMRSEDPPAAVTPCVTEMKPDASPIFHKYRRQGPAEREWLKSFTQELLRCNLIYRTYNSQWASPAFAVRKPDGSFRMVVDLRSVNIRSIPTYWPMPHLDSVVQRLCKSKYYISLDLFKGFWLMPLAKESQAMFAFSTEDGVFVPVRTLQGATNSAVQFQARMHEVFHELQDNVEIWIDDMLGHAATLDEWFKVLERILYLAAKYKLKLSAKKCSLFATEVKFCGRIFNADGVSHDSGRINALVNIPYPSTAKELQQFLLCAQWMSSNLPDFAKITEPLMTIYNLAMKGEPLRTKRAATRKQLHNYGWNTLHDEAFDKLKESLRRCTQLAYPDPEMVQCVFTDASDFHSAGMITQIPVEDIDKPFDEQRHQPLGFCSHRFSDVEKRWSTPDKEAYAIIDVFRKLNYLLVGRTVLYTDHKNLVNMFNPEGMKVQSSARLHRWNLELNEHRFTIKHIAGTDNVWADLLSRWGSRFKETLELNDDELESAMEPLTPENSLDSVDQDYRVLITRAILEEQSEIPDYRVQPMNKLRWPTLHELQEAQKVLKPSPHFILNEETSLWEKSNRVIIPDQDRALRLRLVVISHAGRRGGHCGIELTEHQLREKFTWRAMRTDVVFICNGCLHCLPTRSGIKIPRPLGTAVHGQKPSQVLHYDFLYIQPGETPWVLAIRDDFTGLVNLRNTSVPESTVVVDSLLNWRSNHGASLIYVSDQASYFQGKVMNELSVLLGVEQHATTAYIHYNNGSIEVINKLILQAFRTMLSELRLKKSDWPKLLPIVEYYLNHKPQARLNNRAPVTVMNGVEADNPLNMVFAGFRNDEFKLLKLNLQRMTTVLDELLDQLDTIHKDVSAFTDKQRERARQFANRRRHRANFIIGDYVLVAKEVHKSGQKLYLTWRGPYQITETETHYVFKVRDILSDEILIVHGERMKYYAHADLDITEELKLQKAYDDESFVIEQCLDEKIEYGETKVLLKWRGFSEAENTWEPLHVLLKDAPLVYEQFQKTRADVTSTALSGVKRRRKR